MNYCDRDYATDPMTREEAVSFRPTPLLSHGPAWRYHRQKKLWSWADYYLQALQTGGGQRAEEAKARILEEAIELLGYGAEEAFELLTKINKETHK